MLFNNFETRGLLFDKEGGGSGDDPAPTESGGRLDPARLQAKHGSAEAALHALAHKLDRVERDNAQYREEIRSLKERLPSDDAVLLDGDEVGAWKQYREIGSPEEIKATISKASETSEELAQLRRNEKMRDVAKVTGVNLDVLRSAKGSDALEYEIRKEGSGDEKREVVYVKPDSDDEGDPVPFDDYVETHWSPLKTALFADGDGGSRSQNTFIKQSPSGTPPKKGATAEDIRKAKAESGKYAL